MQDLSQLMDGLSGFLGTSYTAYNAADNARAFLRAHGFCELTKARRGTCSRRANTSSCGAGAP